MAACPGANADVPLVRNAEQHSEGFQHVLVNGVAVVSNRKVMDSVARAAG